ncbi:MAG: DUF4062 domain-containing protein [Anaerolineae bacterium]|nr:DUF4062 domain-containing protein [Anaerolineae bacterium]
MARELRVFISSTMKEELKDERAAVADLIAELSTPAVQLRPWVFERDAPASDRPVREVYLQALRESQLYLGIFALTLGKWTHDEFTLSQSLDIPRHLYVKQIASDQPEQPSPELVNFLASVQTVTEGVTLKYFPDGGRLWSAVKASVMTWIDETYPYFPGLSSAIYAERPEELRRPERLIGRDDLMAEVTQHLDDRRRVLLHGFSGIGKSSLAATLAGQWIAADKGHVLWLQVGSESTEFITEAIAKAFNKQQEIAGQRSEDRILSVQKMLRDSQVSLVVIDDAWNKEAIADIIRAIPPTIAVMITSRLRKEIGFFVDEMHEVTELTLDKALEALSHYSRMDLSANEHAKELCELVGKHPYALEIAGKTLRVDPDLTVEKLIERIKNAPAETLRMAAQPGRENISKLITVSLNGLSSADRRAFMAIGALFAPIVTPELVALYLGTAEATVEASLNRLVERGLARIHQNGTTYYSVHDLAYAHAQFSALETDKRSALDACLAYAQKYIGVEALSHNAIKPVLDGIVNAALWALFHRESAKADAIVDAIWDDSRVLLYQASYAQAQDLFTTALDAATSRQDAPAEARYHRMVGTVIRLRGQPNEAAPILELAVAQAKALSLQREQAYGLLELALAYNSQGKASVALKTQEDALAVMRVIGDFSELSGQPRLLANMGVSYMSMGDFEAARMALTESLELGRRFNQELVIAADLAELGRVEIYLGHPQQAVAWLTESQVMFERVDFKRDIVKGLGNLGRASIDLGDLPKALDYCEQSVALAEANGSTALINFNSGHLALALLLSGDLERANTVIERAYQQNVAYNNAHIAMLKGIIALRRGDKAEAESAFARATENAEQHLTGENVNIIALEAIGIAYAGLAVLRDAPDVAASLRYLGRLMDITDRAAGIRTSYTRLVRIIGDTLSKNDLFEPIYGL